MDKRRQFGLLLVFLVFTIIASAQTNALISEEICWEGCSNTELCIANLDASINYCLLNDGVEVNCNSVSNIDLSELVYEIPILLILDFTISKHWHHIYMSAIVAIITFSFYKN